jgi:acetyl esterase/lipase
LIFKLHNKIFKKTALEHFQGNSGKKFKKRKGFLKDVVFGVDVFSKINSNAICDIIYLHGGAYVVGLNVTHFMFVNQLGKRIDANIHIIDYPLAEKSTVLETVEITKKVITEIKKKMSTSFLFITGDSAGGGLALSISSVLEKNYFDAMYLFSPWLNIKMDHPDTSKYQKDDVILDIDNLILCAKQYTNNNVEEPLASPIELKPNSDNLHIYVGDCEVFYPDTIEYERKYPSAHVYLYQGGAHAFPMFSFTKDQKYVIKEIASKMKETIKKVVR